MNINFKKIISRSIYFLSILAAVFLLSVLINGMWLVGLPKEEDVERAEISYQSLSGEIKSFNDERNIELAVSLSNFLKYVPFKSTDA